MHMFVRSAERFGRRALLLVLLASLGAPELDAQTTRRASTSARKASATKAKSSSKRTAPRKSRRPPQPPPLVGTEPVGDAALSADLATLLRARVKEGTWGVVVTSISRGDTLFTHNADVPLMPASTQKLFTTVLAFERLGVHYQMSTDVLRSGIVDNGVLRGSLILRGSGDPALSGRFLGGTPEAPMRALAEMVANAGIKKVEGDLVGDASAFDGQRIPDGWLNRYLNASYAARVSALSLNENLLHVAITPTRSQRAATVTLRPGLSGIAISNQTRTRAGRGSRLTVSRTSNGTVVAKGWIGAKAGTRVYTVVVDDPAKFAIAAFKRALQDAGVEVRGDIRLGATPMGAEAVGALSSPPISQLAKVMNGESDNHFAELLLRAAARGSEGSGVGSARLGNEQLRALLAERAGVEPRAIQVSDGSGLSSLNRVTPRALNSLLMYAWRAPWAREFYQTLPVAGVSETLRGRMIATPAQGNLHAKTGTTNDVISLGGYVTSRSGEVLAFSMLYNGRERWHARETIDAMGATLAGFSRESAVGSRP